MFIMVAVYLVVIVFEIIRSIGQILHLVNDHSKIAIVLEKANEL